MIRKTSMCRMVLVSSSFQADAAMKAAS